MITGAVQGSLCANDKIVVSETAVINGDLTAPALSVADGAQVYGRIDAAGRGGRIAVISGLAAGNQPVRRQSTGRTQRALPAGGEDRRQTRHGRRR
jgi:cytoskeletal protein CcmA (bactofilin family)